jgi:GPH family glycoside/pentoside/hexuronide:cation symporter
MSANATKLSLKEKIGYGLGDTASHFVWDMVGFWILIFYTDTFGQNRS